MKINGLGNKEILSKNLKMYIDINGKNDRAELAKDLAVPYTTLTDWINGTSYPRIDKIELMARYFKILKSDLIEEHEENYYYISEDTRMLAQELSNNAALRSLMDASRNATPEDLEITKNLLLSLKMKEQKGDD